MSMIAEHDRIVLIKDLPQENLRAGDVGTVVFVHAHGVAYEVEFLTLDGVTVAVATVESSQLRPAGHADITHTRSLAGVA